MRHYKVVNRKRFICFLISLIMALCFIVLGSVNISSAKEKKDLRYTKVVIEEGDTLWELAKLYGDGSKDIREIIYEICSINDIKASDLIPGMTILIPAA